MLTSMDNCHPLDTECELCGDVARAMRVMSVDAASGMAIVMMDGETLSVAIDLVPEAVAGDVLLVHLGFAIERVQS